MFGEVSGKNVNLARSKRNPNGLNGSCDSVRPFFRQRNVEEPRQRDTQKGKGTGLFQYAGDYAETIVQGTGQVPPIQFLFQH